MGHLTLNEIFQKVEQKKEAYRKYNFERLKEEAFATFFDLAQEFTFLEHLYMVSVAVPKIFFDVDSELYIIDPKTKKLEKVCSSKEGLIAKPNRVSDQKISSLEALIKEIAEKEVSTIQESRYQIEKDWAFIIRGNIALTQWVSFSGIKGILGVFLVSFPKEPASLQEELFFFEKFANRIGYNLHQKLLIQQNLDYIKFINQLVADIEHNVISPNLYYKLYIKRLKKNFESYQSIQKRIRDLIIFSQEQAEEAITQELCNVYYDLSNLNEIMAEEADALEKHYNHTSLFLETLFRREHFIHGTYVLRKQPCNFKQEIVNPLLERYMPMFEKKGIAIRKTADDIPDENLNLFVDKGLISQVLDNLLSNALKYTEEIEDPLGNRVKLVSIDRQILKNFFGEGIHGIRINVFTTGTPLSPEEAEKVFEEGYRVIRDGKASSTGSGHGLYFVKNVIEIHGGKVGCEPEKYGNTFFFVLPFS